MSSTEQTIYLADPLRAELEGIAEREGVTLKALAERACAQYLAQGEAAAAWATGAGRLEVPGWMADKLKG